MLGRASQATMKEMITAFLGGRKTKNPTTIGSQRNSASWQNRSSSRRPLPGPDGLGTRSTRREEARRSPRPAPPDGGCRSQSSAGPMAEPDGQVAVLQDPAELRRHVARIARLVEQAVDPVNDDLGDAADPGGDQRAARAPSPRGP